MFPIYVFLSLVSGSGCPPSVIVASSDTSKVELSPGQYMDAILVTKHPIWPSLDGANWVWANTDCQPSEATNWEWPNCGGSTYKFVSTFTLPEWMRNRMVSLTLTVDADNLHVVDFNGVNLTPQVSGRTSHELKDIFLGSTGHGGILINKLEITATNTDGPAGLIFKVQLDR